MKRILILFLLITYTLSSIAQLPVGGTSSGSDKPTTEIINTTDTISNWNSIVRYTGGANELVTLPPALLSGKSKTITFFNESGDPIEIIGYDATIINGTLSNILGTGESITYMVIDVDLVQQVAFSKAGVTENVWIHAGNFSVNPMNPFSNIPQKVSSNGRPHIYTFNTSGPVSLDGTTVISVFVGDILTYYPITDKWQLTKAKGDTYQGATDVNAGISGIVSPAQSGERFLNYNGQGQWTGSHEFAPTNPAPFVNTIHPNQGVVVKDDELIELDAGSGNARNGIWLTPEVNWNLAEPITGKTIGGQSWTVTGQPTSGKEMVFAYPNYTTFTWEFRSSGGGSALSDVKVQAVKPTPLTTFTNNIVIDSTGIDSMYVWNTSKYDLFINTVSSGGGGMVEYTDNTSYPVGTFITAVISGTRCTFRSADIGAAANLGIAITNGWLEFLGQSDVPDYYQTVFPYPYGFLIYQEGKLWKKNSLTNSANFTSTEWFDLSTPGTANIRDWLPSTFYNQGDIKQRFIGGTNVYMVRLISQFSFTAWDNFEAGNWRYLSQQDNVTTFSTNADMIAGYEMFIDNVLWQKLNNNPTGAAFDNAEKANWRKISGQSRPDVRNVNTTTNLDKWGGTVLIGTTPLISDIVINIPDPFQNLKEQITFIRVDNTSFKVTLAFAGVTIISTNNLSELNTQNGAVTIEAISNSLVRQVSGSAINTAVQGVFNGEKYQSYFIANGNGAFNTIGSGAIGSAGTLANVALTTGGYRQSVQKTLVSTTATAGNVASIRNSTLECYGGEIVSSRAYGGYQFECEFGLNIFSVSSFFFCGLQTIATAPTSLDPTTSTTNGKIGMAINSSTGNMKLVFNVPGAAPTVTDLTHCPINNTDYYRLSINKIANSVNTVVDITNLQTNVKQSFVLSSNTPTNATFLARSMYISNNVTAAINNFAITRMALQGR